MQAERDASSIVQKGTASWISFVAEHCSPRRIMSGLAQLLTTGSSIKQLVNVGSLSQFEPTMAGGNEERGMDRTK
jgi:hypothetical protein